MATSLETSLDTKRALLGSEERKLPTERTKDACSRAVEDLSRLEERRDALCVREARKMDFLVKSSLQIQIADFSLFHRPWRGEVIIIDRKTFISLLATLLSTATPSQKTEIVLPQDPESLEQALFILHRNIESAYRFLPWPSQLQNIAVLTKVQGGRGDISAAAKAITVMQRICPSASFDWILTSGDRWYNPASFLTCDDASQVTIRSFPSSSSETAPVDFLIAGPVTFGWGNDYVESRIMRKIEGPTCSFQENAQEFSSVGFCELLQRIITDAPAETDPTEQYSGKLHGFAFPHGSRWAGSLPMGLQPGTGVFLDQSRIEAPLSRRYCCPSYLLNIEDDDLRSDILSSMDANDDLEPDYDRFSFNSGYAHHSVSWGKFIDCVAIHEKEKHVVIVLNQSGEFKKLNNEEFRRHIFTTERLAFLESKGYGMATFKGQGEEPTIVQKKEDVADSRRLTVIVRPNFTPSDMKCLQLSSERILATGDNSAVEAWCARCKLYLYEDVANGGCKWRFLQQQVDLAETISPNLSKLLALFGEDRRLLKNALNSPLSAEKMAEMEECLLDPHLSESTEQFCHLITTQYSFGKVLEGSLKRAAWHHIIPELQEVEAKALSREFRSGLISYLKNPEEAEKTLPIEDLSELKKQVFRIIMLHLPLPALSKKRPHPMKDVVLRGKC